MLCFLSDQEGERILLGRKNPDLATGACLSKAKQTVRSLRLEQSDVSVVTGSIIAWNIIPCSVPESLWFRMLIAPLLFPVSAKRGNGHRLAHPQNGSGQKLPAVLETRSFWETTLVVTFNWVFGCLDRGSTGNGTGPELLCTDEGG